VARFSVGFLGCKVSHVDVQEIRDRLRADGHLEGGVGESADVAVLSTCCVTHEAVALPAEKMPAAVCGDGGAIGCSFACAFCVIPTGVNLGCFRDRAAGDEPPRLVRDLVPVRAHAVSEEGIHAVAA